MAPADDELVDALAQTTFVIMAAMSTIGAEHDLSLTQLRVLQILRDRRLRMTALAAYLGLEKSTMSGLVDRAERRGLMARAPSADDGRVIEVFLTPAGAELADALRARLAGLLAERFGVLSAIERARTAGLLRRMLDGDHQGMGPSSLK